MYSNFLVDNTCLLPTTQLWGIILESWNGKSLGS